MHKAKIHTIGPYTGTVAELSKITKVSRSNMDERIKKWKLGQYSADKTMTIGPISTGNLGNKGNTAWLSLSSRLADASLIPEDIPLNWNYNT